MNLTIRPIKSAEDGRHIEQIGMAAWGSDGLEAIPGHLSQTIAKENGGVVLLAFDGDRPIGFCWGFWAYVESKQKWKCASHMAGVIPEYKGKGLGAKLKWAQRAYALKKGFDWMTWTYDPLETMNGSLNIRKLGAVCNTYYQNLYGLLDDELNRGIETDRFGVDWWLSSGWVESHESKKPEQPTVDSILADDGLLLNQSYEKNRLLIPEELIDVDMLNQGPRYLLLQVPRDFQGVKKSSIASGIAWRMHTRKLFTTAFDNNYTVIDLILGDPICHYLFENNWKPK
ncbi:MAG: GNAT family N-acetyltransferase [Chloroflexota bacterium]